jgi:NAD-dependent SIR2 family protein deacetylase
VLAEVASRAGGLAEAVELLRGRRVTALTGAGISTESGIPDYRGPGTRARARLVPDGAPSVRRGPIQHGQFVRDAAARRRYWARSVIGWPRVAAAEPNPAHAALAALERRGILAGVVTQNVDRLHARAGSQRVIELHGALGGVACLDCGGREARADLQSRLLAMNPGFASRGAELAPDGDAELPAALVDAFVVADCTDCGGVLKPEVVFFGGSVARDVVDAACALVDEAEALLVVGSSLEVYSGYRFVRRAAERAMPVAIVNLGPTRGDALAALRWDERAGAALPALAAALAG